MADGTAHDTVKLTPKQEAFARAYVECSNASEAYRQTYDVGPTAKPQGIWVNACKVLANANVSLRVEQLQAEARERHGVTIDSITAMLNEDRKLAHQVGQPGAAVSAVMGLAKIHGLVIDKAKTENSNTGTLVVTWGDADN